MKNSIAGLGRQICAILLFVATTATQAIPVVDQSFDATGGGSSYAIEGSQSLAQVFTVGIGGLLTGVDLQLDRTTQATGSFTVSVLSASGGVPLGNGSSLFSVTLPVAAITTIGPFQYDYFSVDVSGAGILVTPGEELAIAVTHNSSGYPDWVQWEASVGSGAFHGNGSLTTSYGVLAQSSLGFRTFVQPGVVPEPASISLVAIGMVAAAIGRRRRKV